MVRLASTSFLRCLICALLLGHAGFLQLSIAQVPGPASHAVAPAALLSRRASDGARNQALREYLGPDTPVKPVEEAIERGLAWLAAQQSPDGSFGNTPMARDKAALTALTMLAALGHGETPQSGPRGAMLTKAAAWLVEQGAANQGYLSLRKGKFPPDAANAAEVGVRLPHRVASIRVGGTGKLPEESLYRWPDYADPWSHAVSVTALAEYTAVTTDPKAEALLRLALEKILAAQQPSGGWNEHFAGADSPACLWTSAWQTRALHAVSLTRLGDARVRPALEKGGRFAASMRRGREERYALYSSENHGEPRLGAAGAFLGTFAGAAFRLSDFPEVAGLLDPNEPQSE